MRVTAVSRHNAGAWENVSPFWKDAISSRFQVSVLAEMERVLQTLDKACADMEQATDHVIKQLSQYEAV
jgi:hypothetical protein